MNVLITSEIDMSDERKLNKLLGIDWKKGIVKLEELNYYGKDSYTTRRIDKKEV